MKQPIIPLLIPAALGIGLMLPNPLLAQSKDQQRLSNEIKRLTAEISQQKQQSTAISHEVDRLEQKLGEISAQQHETEEKIEITQTRLQEANQNHEALSADLKVQQQALAQQLQAMFTAGEQSHLRLLLRQDNPSDISRTLRYFEYLNNHRSKKIQQINQTIEKIRTVARQMEHDRSELKGLEETLAVKKRDIQSTLQEREKALKTVNSDLKSQQNRLGKLKREEEALEAKIERIARRAAEQAAQREAAQQATSQSQPITSSANTTNTPRPAPAPTGRVVQQSTAPLPRGRSFASLRGKLPAPVNGRILHTYGSRRNEKQFWRGVVIAAPGGAKVQAIAPGRVAFAGWMDGYGHLIIIEHDANYMSLYGYNRAVYKREGQTVRANETIAAVGNSSGQSQDALYFEIRYKKATQNPAHWLR